MNPKPTEAVPTSGLASELVLDDSDINYVSVASEVLAKLFELQLLGKPPDEDLPVLHLLPLALRILFPRQGASELDLREFGVPWSRRTRGPR